jgi:hypothetical protein
MNSDLPGVVSKRDELVDRYCEALYVVIHSLLEDAKPGYRQRHLDAVRAAIEVTGRKLSSLVGEEWAAYVPPKTPDPEPPELVLSESGRKLPRWMRRWLTGE